MRNILIEPFSLIEKIKEKSLDQAKEPYVVLFCGINWDRQNNFYCKNRTAIKKTII